VWRVGFAAKGAQDRRLEPNANLEALVDADLDTLATALYVTTDELLKSRPELAPWRPAVGIKPQVSDAELVTLAALAAMLGFACEARWVRYARAHLVTCSRTCPPSLGTTSGCGASAGCSTC